MPASALPSRLAYPLSNDDISALLPGVPITLYPAFADDPPLAAVADAHGRGVVLFLDSVQGTSLGGHWLAFIIRNRVAELFDPYGGTGDPWQLDRTFVRKGVPALVRLGQEHPLMVPYFKRHGFGIDPSETRLQLMKEGVGTCGRHCVVRLWRSNLTSDAYATWLTSFPQQPPDVVVTLLTDQVLDKQE